MCTKCGTRLRAAAPAQASAAAPVAGAVQAPGVSSKSRLTATLLCFFLGGIGVHRFYVGRVGSGIAQIFTAGGLGIWTLVDFIMILSGKFSDSKGNMIVNWTKP
jgi:TM2 domain-containing membrane protein YozV